MEFIVKKSNVLCYCLSNHLLNITGVIVHNISFVRGLFVSNNYTVVDIKNIITTSFHVVQLTENYHSPKSCFARYFSLNHYFFLKFYMKFKRKLKYSFLHSNKINKRENQKEMFGFVLGRESNPRHWRDIFYIKYW